jgi:NADPH:quinone reductase-like Zn-dependent oxidoreductase
MTTEPPPYPLLTALAKNLTISAFMTPFLTDNSALLERGKQFVFEGFTAGQFKLVIAPIFPFAETVAAHRYMESNQQLGKLVVTVP